MHYVLVCALIYARLSEASLISSSEIQMCAKTSSENDPVLSSSPGNCKKKMVVAMTLQNGQVRHYVIAILVDFKTICREQLTKSTPASSMLLISPLELLAGRSC